VVVVDDVVVDVVDDVEVDDVDAVESVEVDVDGVVVAVDTSTELPEAGSPGPASAAGSVATGPADIPPLCVVLHAAINGSSAGTMTAIKMFVRLATPDNGIHP
jgi:hypothetical protein